MVEHKPSKPLRDIFWEAFILEANALRESVLLGNTLAAHQRIQHLLAAAGYFLPHELTSEGETAILVFTPEGNPSRAELVDWFVGSAPRLSGWGISNRRQQKPLTVALRLAQAASGVDIGIPLFFPIECSDGLAVMVFSQASDGLPPGDNPELMELFLEHLLGEDLCMRVRVRGTLHRMPPNQTGLIDAAALLTYCSTLPAEHRS